MCKSAAAMRTVSCLNGKHLMISGPSVSCNSRIMNMFKFRSKDYLVFLVDNSVANSEFFLRTAAEVSKAAGTAVIKGLG